MNNSFMYQNECTSTVFALRYVIALTHQVPLLHRTDIFYLKTLKLLAIDFNTKVTSAYQQLSGTLKNARSLRDDHPGEYSTGSQATTVVST